MAYTSASNVATYCRQLLSNDIEFTDATNPTLTDVEGWIEDGADHIDMALYAKGYSSPVATSSTVYGVVRRLNTYYAVAQAEFARTNVIVGPGERTRGAQFDKMFQDGLAMLLKSDLTLAGVETVSSPASIYVGGISRADKLGYEQDTDRVNPRIRRGMFKFPEASSPDNYSTSGSSSQ